jgi:asparagine synthase (glutamine-hydrolysing)
MCGIASIFAYGSDAPPVDRTELLRIRERMIARGPDGCGEWYSADGRVGLAHRRLSIIDLSSSGAQPMACGDGNLVITYNGEIYNYRELRAGLEARGCHFRSSSDTEVLLELYREKGADMLHELRGMYAFAIWDTRDGHLFLARDPFGIKPLYYADNGRTIRIASQVKALLAGGGVDTEPQPAGHVGFYLWGTVPEPYTLYRGIRALPAGSYLSVNCRGTGAVTQFCSIPREIAQASEHAEPLSPDQVHERLREAMFDTVRHHLVADVPVGVFLSSGLDSTTLAALTSELAPGSLHTVTLGFKEFAGTASDEVPLAEKVARLYGAEHRTIIVGKRDFQGELPRLLDAMDQPSTDGVNSYFVCRAAAQAGLKVVLSGLGGDELFGSYPSFQQVPRLVRAVRPIAGVPGLGRGFRFLSAPLLKHLTSPKYAGLLEYGGSYGGAYLLRRGMYMPWELPGVLDGDLVREGWAELQTIMRLDTTVRNLSGSYQKIAALEMSWYMRNQLLRDADWASMAHSLEVRVPFVDLKLLRAVTPLLCSSAPISKKDMARTPTIPLPAAILNRSKSGFSVPVREWLIEDEGCGGERGLRMWAHNVCADQPRLSRTLVLLTDAYGGTGGIALYNRDFLSALCSLPGCLQVVALPRIMPRLSEEMPARLTYVTGALGGKGRYIWALLKLLSKDRGFDRIVCGHLYMLPLAYLAKLITGAPIVLEIYGIDAWQPTHSFLTNRLVHSIDAFVSISEITKQRFLAWARIDEQKGHLLPNAIHLDQYSPGAKSPLLLQRYGLQGRKVLMTLGRLVSHERYKGFDEVMDLLPEIARDIPEIAYLIVGDGNDRLRLEEKARTLGVSDRVVFSGYIAEEEKADHYRLADLYVMPSQGEGFGFVFLEALACGIPAIGSKVDGSREALKNGELGTVIDPADARSLKSAIIKGLKQQDRNVPEGLDYFSFNNFKQRLFDIVVNISAES